MEQNNIRYPFFWPKQALSSRDLNESFGYVEEQERITRAWMIGNGIISGLIFDTTETGGKLTSVTVNSGFGVTPDGYGIRLKNRETYSFCIKITDAGLTDEGFGLTGFKDTCLLLSAAEADLPKFKPKAMPLSQENPANYCLAYYAEIEQENAIECNLFNCNLDGSHKHMQYRLLLINKLTNQDLLQQVNPFDQLTHIRLKTLNLISSVKDGAAYRSKITRVVQSNEILLNAKLKEVSDCGTVLFQKHDTDYHALNLSGVFNTTASPFNQYHVAFQLDLQDAINEFISALNNFNYRYAITALRRLDRFLVLGAVRKNLHDPYRYRFAGIESIGTYRSDYYVLHKLYNRLYSLIVNFIPGQLRVLPSGTIKITPCKGSAAALGDRSIPFYYTVSGNSTVPAFWHAHEPPGTTDQVFNYTAMPDPTPADYDKSNLLCLAAYPFYRIEGHVGLSVKQANEQLSKLIKVLDLPVKMALADLSNDQWVSLFDTYTKFAEDYNKFRILFRGKVEAVVNDKFNKAKVVATFLKPLNDVSATMVPENYYDIALMNQQVNIVKAFLGNCSEVKLEHLPVDQNFKTEFAAILRKDGEVHAEITNLLTRNISDIAKKMKDVSVNRQLPLSAYQGTESLGGVAKGGSFILLINEGIVVGDIALPYLLNK